ncbi:hybrid sensor histidine kinase/response regulator transcription factor [Mucilaginibacter boryungensis]|uniref:histidine kinase n=1 Tax=Mucilaginibacter boryungensis TaxID=768480 RepID=A0ABR9XFF1_9SPHI|nr:hybrid sensor histidine kinase/response regulator transcription factor [Mucilaginibacter boryungensis]MBE9665734.1 response regulator [Mucilaginibacter boryungensis]
MKLTVKICVLFTLMALGTYGQRIAFENLTVDDGLSQNSVLAISQDNRGFMWYGTQHGLNKYDATNFKTYKNNGSDKSSLSSDYVTCLLLDSHQQLWIGTRNGLNRYKPETDNFERITFNNTLQKTGNLIISCIYEDKEKNLWVWTSRGLHKLINRATAKFAPLAISDSVAGLNGTNVHVIYQDYTGSYWLGSSAGLTKMKIQRGQLTFQKYRHQATQINSLSDNYVTAITEDLNHQLWVGTLHGGINLYNRANNSFTRFLSNNGNRGPVNNNIRVLRPDNSGKIWVGTQGGLNILDPLNKQFIAYQHNPEDKSSLSQNSIYDIFINKNNIVWIGTYWGGINMVSSHNTAFLSYQTTHYHSTINNNVVSAIAEDMQHNLWIGTEGGGLNYFDRKKDVVTTYQNKVNSPSSLGSDLIKVIYIDKSKNVWAGTHGGGLNLFNPLSKQFTRFLYKENDPATLSAEVLCLLEASQGNFWVGTQSGLRAYRRNDITLQAIGHPILSKIGHRSIKGLLEDKDKNIWIGTSEGVFLLNAVTGKVSMFTVADGLKSNDINTIYQDSKSRIWTGSYYGGLAVYNSELKRFTSYGEKEGLANDNVLGILEDAGNNLWVSTGNGLSKFSIATRAFKNYTKSDGLSGNTFNINSCLKTSDGEMLFGGFNGLTSFFPSQIEDNNVPPPVVITSLKLFGKPIGINQPDKLLSKDISLTDNIIFSHSQNVFSIDFAALNYIKSEKNKYAYKLEGFDKDWVRTNIPSATFTNLVPGNYTFFVKGANNDGVWGQAAELRIKVLPPIWATGWAYVLYVLFIGGITFLLARFFILRSLLRRDKELTYLKLNFFTNISHEIRTHLSLIFGPLEKLILDGNAEGNNTTHLQIVKKNADSLLQLVNELMDFRKAETGNLKLNIAAGNIVTLLREVYSSFDEYAVTRNISTSFITSGDDIELYFDIAQLEKVFFNLIHNAFKFTGDNGQIALLIEERKYEVIITVTDNGKGIAPENLKSLFENYFQENDHGKQNTGYGIGLALAKSIIELHKGFIVVESKLSPEGNYTSFAVTLLKGAAHFKNIQPNGLPVTDLQPSHKPFIVDYSKNPDTAISKLISSANKKKLVLLVEDNQDIREFIGKALRENYEVIAVADGMKGWEAACEHIPDVIISDVMMPDMDGFELCDKIKSDERTNHIPVILLTAKASGVYHVEGLKMGADVYLTKPFSVEVLLLQVTNMLNNSEKLRCFINKQLKSTHDLANGFLVENVGEKTKKIAHSIDNEFLNKAIKIIEDHLDNPGFNVSELAKAVAMSQPVLYKKLNALTGLSVNDFIKSIKMNNAVILLQSKRYTINEIAYMVGFSDRKYFSKEFKKQYGKTPSEFTA